MVVCWQTDRTIARRAVRELLTSTGQTNLELQAVRKALGVNDDQPILFPGHPIIDAVVAAGGTLASIIIPDHTKEASAIANLSDPIFKEFHTLICKSLFYQVFVIARC